MKAVHFGAGAIGRGFIGELLHQSGYHVTFVDVSEAIVDQINAQGSYDLYDLDTREQIVIDDIDAINSIQDPAAAAAAVAEADIVTTAVMVANLRHIAPVMLEGLKQRLAKGAKRINILACENALGNSTILHEELAKLDADFAPHLDEVAAFPCTAVDRVVLPERDADGHEVIRISGTFELDVELPHTVDPSRQEIKGASYVDDLQKFIERKLFLLNGGHAWTGYIGLLHGHTTIQEVLRDQKLLPYVRETMGESAALLEARYGFAREDLDAYIDFIIKRWLTPGMSDPIFRVCRNPIQKLGPKERLTSPTLGCEDLGLPFHRHAQGIAAGLLFDNPEDGQSVELKDFIAQNGVEAAVEKYVGVAADTELFREVVTSYQQFAVGNYDLD